MVRTQIQFSDEQLRYLKARAAREHVSVSSLVRRAVTLWETGEPAISPEAVRQRAMEAAGRFASGLRDVARQHDDYLADAYRS